MCKKFYHYYQLLMRGREFQHPEVGGRCKSQTYSAIILSQGGNVYFGYDNLWTSCQAAHSKSLDLLNADSNCSLFGATGLESVVHILTQALIRHECCNLSSLLDGIQIKIITNVARKHLFCKYCIKSREFLCQTI